MGLYRRPDSPQYWLSVTLDGRRFREPCGTADRAEALRVLKRRRAELARLYTPGRKPELTLNDALVRYWREHAERLASADDIARMGETLIAGLGGGALLSAIVVGDVATYVARRRAKVSDGSVNRELTLLRAVLRMAALRWGVAVAQIDWRRQFLVEPAPRQRTLTAEEEERLLQALRPDFHGLVRFALASGVRLDNALTLTWPQIDFAAGAIRLVVKSRRPGGDHHLVPLTRTLRALLGAERGRHPTRVFTYIPQRARAAGRPNGTRVPFTRAGWRKSWKAALDAAGIADFRFHDLRHTFGTRLYRASGDIRATQKALGHRDIASTLRYENAGLDDLRDQMERVDSGRRRIGTAPKRA